MQTGKNYENICVVSNHGVFNINKGHPNQKFLKCLNDIKVILNIICAFYSDFLNILAIPYHENYCGS